MHGLQACLFKCITVAAIRIYAQHGEDANKRGGWRPCIKVMEITFLIMENHGKNDGIVFLNFCENPYLSPLHTGRFEGLVGR